MPVSNEPTERKHNKSKMKLTGQTPAHLVGIGITPYTTGPNVVAINEPPALQGSLRCGGAVGLRVESADVLDIASQLDQRAKDYDREATEKSWWNTRRSKESKRDAAILRHCADVLRRNAEAETVRQPEPNTEVTGAQRPVE